MKSRRMCTIGNCVATRAAIAATSCFHENGGTAQGTTFYPSEPARSDTHVRNAQLRKQIRPRKQRGVAAVEFALVLPILLMIIFGIIELGIALYDKAVITNASREGARHGIVLHSPKYNDDQISSVATQYTKNFLMTFGKPVDPIVKVTGSGGLSGTDLSVEVSYTYRGLGLGAMLSAVTGPIVLTASTTMKNE